MLKRGKLKSRKVEESKSRKDEGRRMKVKSA